MDRLAGSPDDLADDPYVDSIYHIRLISALIIANDADIGPGKQLQAFDRNVVVHAQGVYLAGE